MMIYKCVRKPDKSLQPSNPQSDSYMMSDMFGRNAFMTGQQIKDLMRSGEIDVSNLTLTSDNRLVDASVSKEELYEDFLKSPYDLKCNAQFKVADTNTYQAVYSAIDNIVRVCLANNSKDEVKKYCVASKLNQLRGKDERALVMKYALSPTMRVICNYTPICYGIIQEDEIVYRAFFDMSMEPTQIISSIGSGKLEDIPCTLLSRIGDTPYVQLRYKVVNNKIVWDKKTLMAIAEAFGLILMMDTTDNILEFNLDVDMTQYEKFARALKSKNEERMPIETEPENATVQTKSNTTKTAKSSNTNNARTNRSWMKLLGK